MCVCLFLCAIFTNFWLVQTQVYRKRSVDSYNQLKKTRILIETLPFFESLLDKHALFHIWGLFLSSALPQCFVSDTPCHIQALQGKHLSRRISNDLQKNSNFTPQRRQNQSFTSNRFTQSKTSTGCDFVFWEKANAGGRFKNASASKEPKKPPKCASMKPSGTYFP